MKKSILTNNLDVCVICRKPREAIHHIYGGHGRRAISDREGFIIPLCNLHHNMGVHSVHFDKKMDLALKKLCQRTYEKTHTREEFIKLIGRNYLD